MLAIIGHILSFVRTYIATPIYHYPPPPPAARPSIHGRERHKDWFDLLLSLHLCFAGPNSQHKSQAFPPKSVATHVSMSYLELRAWDHVQSGKSQFPCSQRLRLRMDTASDLGFMTWGPV